MSTMMVYALKGAIGGAVENVWGYDMQVSRIDSSDKSATDAAKANGYTDKAQDIIEQIKAKAMQKDNDRMKGQLSGDADKKRIKELEVELAGALIESAKLESELKHAQDKLAIYEESKDANGNGKVDYEEMTISELSVLLKQRDIEFNARDGKAALVKLATDSE